MLEHSRFFFFFLRSISRSYTSCVYSYFLWDVLSFLIFQFYLLPPDFASPTGRIQRSLEKHLRYFLFFPSVRTYSLMKHRCSLFYEFLIWNQRWNREISSKWGKYVIVWPSLCQKVLLLESIHACLPPIWPSFFFPPSMCLQKENGLRIALS